MGDLLKGIFNDLFPELYKKTPLQKKRNTDSEMIYWREKLYEQGEKIILAETTKAGENIIIYYNPTDDGILILRSVIFSEEGVNSLTPSMFLTYKNKYQILEIADIRMEDNDANKGYGSILMRALFLVIEEYPLPIKYITGWISGVDWHHVERNKHFYEKFGFSVELNHLIKEGYILFINPSKGGSKEQYYSLNYKPGLEGLLLDFKEE